MPHTVTFADIDGQRVEPLPQRTVMSALMPSAIGASHDVTGTGAGGGGGDTSGGISDNGSLGTIQSLFFSDGGNGGIGGSGGRGSGGIGVDPTL